MLPRVQQAQAPHQGGQGGFQLVEIAAFAQVVVGADLQAVDAVGAAVERYMAIVLVLGAVAAVLLQLTFAKLALGLGLKFEGYFNIESVSSDLVIKNLEIEIAKHSTE